MKLKVKSRLKNVFSKMTKKRAIISIIVIIAAVVLFKSNIIQNKFFAAKKTVTQNITSVKKGNIVVGISGSGPVSFTNSKKVYGKTSGTVNKLNYKEGDAVKAGDVIYELDSSDAQTAIDTNKSNLQQSQISAVPTDQDVANLTIKAPFAGQVTNIAINKGDTVQKNGVVVTIADTSKLKVALPFKVDDIAQIKVGQTATVTLKTLNQTVQGTVTSVSNILSTGNSGSTGSTGSTGSASTQTGSVEIQVTNPGTIVGAASVSADIAALSGAVSSTSPATLDFITKKDVTSLTGGTVQSISVSANQKVSASQTLVVMKNDDVTRAKQLSDLKMANTVSQVNSNLKTLENFKIVAPIDGVITKLTYKVGDSVKAGDEVSNISDPTQMQFDVPIDELDIAKIAVGQKTTITVDALPSSSTTPVNGEVLKIAVQGTPVSGVTTFPVTIKVTDNLDKLKGGMNANGNIIVSNKQNVLYVPIEAVTTTGGRSIVWVKGAGTGSAAGGNPPTTGTGNRPATGTGGTRPTTGTGGNTGGFNRTGMTGAAGATTSATNYYEGAVRTVVEIGVNNDTSIEIVSGLKEGQVVVLPETKAASAAATSTQKSGLGGLTGGGTGAGGGGGGFTGGGRGN
ncbi:MAG: HlyD family efflux transporter periplasmic adaptor subunit [Clostridiaceae bacterium]|nr:HlyD family efflux transporter periplasmic adaptor subunit [Clostridiaceae bacterium]